MSASNESVIYTFLKDKGLTPAQIAGVLGNLKIESGFSPTAYNPNEGAIGIAQWEGSRRTALQHYASAHGGSERTLNTQLGFMWHELTGGSQPGVLHDLRNAHDPGTAATIWDKEFERSSGSSRGARISAAHSISRAIQSGALTSTGGHGSGGHGSGGHGSGGNGSGGRGSGGNGSGGRGSGSRQRVVVHPHELADVASEVAGQADRTQYIVRGMTRHIAAMDTLVAGGAFVVPDPARFSLARRGLEEALTGKFGAQAAAQGLSDVAAWVEKFRQQILAADAPAGGLGSGGTKPGKHPKHPKHPTPAGHPGSSRSARVSRMLALARKQHIHEWGNNHTKYGRWYGDDGQPWCAQFVSWVFAQSGNKLPSMDSHKKGFEYVPTAIAYARAHHQLFSTPRAGDIFLCKDGHHTGIVSKVYPDGHFDTVEGNAGPGSSMVYQGVRNGGSDSAKGSYYFWTAIRP